MLSSAVPLLRGIAVGAFLVTALSVWRSDLNRDTKITTILTCLSAAAWTLTGSEQVVGADNLLLWLTFPAAGFFWAFVVCVFQDRPFRWATFLPAALLLLLGGVTILVPPGLMPPERNQMLLATFNVAAAGLCLHAVFVVLGSWRDDLVDSRRASRLVILGIAALFATSQGTAGALHWLGRGGVWADLALGEDFRAVSIAALGLAMGGLLLQARATLLPIPAVQVPATLMAADRLLLGKLEAFMDAGGWNREGLSIGVVAQELGSQEHRLRRLINTRLGHRNFADFVNGYRIEAAKTRLVDPTKAEVTIASVAFDLGFGSLSPFNRAFRAATGLTPTAWRKAAQALPDE